MAGGQERVLRRRIRWVQSTRKITKAMELIAAVADRARPGRIAANRPYREGMSASSARRCARIRTRRRRCSARPSRPSGSGFWPSSAIAAWPARTTRACCGQRSVSSPSTGATASRSPCGRSARRRPAYFRYRGIEVQRSFPGIADRPEFVDARDVAAFVTAPFLDDQLDLLQLVSTRYISAGVQRVQTQQLLPLASPDRADHEDAGIDDLPASGSGGYTEFEPDVETLLAELAPRATESEIFAALLEGTASFFTAQQRAMASATENADELVRTLTRVMNRARQDAITTEIMEIVGGAEALRQSKGA